MFLFSLTPAQNHGVQTAGGFNQSGAGIRMLRWEGVAWCFARNHATFLHQ
jgi:hypothetical protein